MNSGNMLVCGGNLSVLFAFMTGNFLKNLYNYVLAITANLEEVYE